MLSLVYVRLFVTYGEIQIKPLLFVKKVLDCNDLIKKLLLNPNDRRLDATTSLFVSLRRILGNEDIKHDSLYNGGGFG
jgi:hypothetical protein